MSASMTLDKSALDRMIARFSDPSIKEELNKLPQKKGVVALVAQAIADNFDKEGPGWAPLKPETIRRSVSKKLSKQIENMSDAELMRWEKRARMEGTMESFVGPNRRILQKTGLLKKSVTVPGAKSNIWRTEGTKLIWGTDLVYAGVHNRGFPAKNIPKRTFLVVRDEWMKQLNEYILAEVVKIIRQKIFRGGS